MADDIKLENYKKSAAKILDAWGAKIAEVGKKLAPIQEELDKLQANDSPSDDDKKKIEDLKRKCAELKKQLDSANVELHTDFMLIDIPPAADEKELVKLPGWLKDIIKRKGLPLGKNVSIAPTIDIDFKKKKVKSFGVKITF